MFLKTLFAIFRGMVELNGGFTVTQSELYQTSLATKQKPYTPAPVKTA